MVGEEMGGRRNWRVIVVFASRMERERLVRKRKRNNKEETKKTPRVAVASQAVEGERWRTQLACYRNRPSRKRI